MLPIAAPPFHSSLWGVFSPSHAHIVLLLALVFTHPPMQSSVYPCPQSLLVFLPTVPLYPSSYQPFRSPITLSDRPYAGLRIPSIHICTVSLPICAQNVPPLYAYLPIHPYSPFPSIPILASISRLSSYPCLFILTCFACLKSLLYQPNSQSLCLLASSTCLLDTHYSRIMLAGCR